MEKARQIILIAHNIRSTHNVGSLLRTAEGLGVTEVILSGYTPYPLTDNDSRLPHLAQKLSKDIHKTALGAETMVRWQHTDSIEDEIFKLRQAGYSVNALEQAQNAVPLTEFSVPPKCALIVGREVEGIEPEILKLCDAVLEIPMFGKKESFNVVQAAAMAMFYCRFY